MSHWRSRRTAVVTLLGISLVLRVSVLGMLPPHAWFEGGDGPWYVRQGWLLAQSGLEEPLRTVGPLYPLALALVWIAFPAGEDPGAVQVDGDFLAVVRVLQALLGTATAALTFSIAHRMQLGRAALFAAAGVGLGPAFVIESFMIRTESLFIFLFTAAVWLHVRPPAAPRALDAAATGTAAALAVLTRPVLLPFPLLLAGHLVVRHGWHRGARSAAVLLASVALVLAPWHVILFRSTGNVLPEGFSSNLWIATQGRGGPLAAPRFHELESGLHESNRGYLDGAARAVLDDPAGWIERRASNWAGAVLQPHGTSDLGGPSVKAQLSQWSADDRTIPGLWRIVAVPSFGLRLLVYAFHYTALVLALAGIARTATRWREWLPVYAGVLYLPAVHVVLMAIPRYLFPIQPLLWVLAAAAIPSWPQPRPRTPAASRSPSVRS
jgi:4-amino-4-deoxy-L-arabinose transferase-like glycosyltransferase